MSGQNPNPQNHRFLSIFGGKVCDKFEPPNKNFDRIQQLIDMGIFTDTTKFRIKNVKQDGNNPYKLAVPTTNGILAGETDAVIQYGINDRFGLDEYLKVVALIEFKTCSSFYTGLPKGIFEYIGITL